MEEDNDLEQVSGSPTSGENEFVHIESVDSAQMDGGSIDQVERLEQDDGVVITGVDTVQDEPPEVKTTEDAGPDEFVDCPDDLISNDGRSPGIVNRVRQLPFGRNRETTQLKTSDIEKEILPQDEEEERKVLLKEVSNLHHQLKALSNQQPLAAGIDDGVSTNQLTLETVEGGEKPLLSLREMVKECSKFIEVSLNERSQAEGTIRELNDTLHMKEKEIEDLMVRVTEPSISQDVALKSDEMSSVEATVDKILYSLATVIGDTELSDISVSGKLSHLERSTSLLLEQYHSFLSEIEMLSHCLAEVKPGFHAQNGPGIVFLSVREELLELKRKELDLTSKNSHFEYQHGQLMEQLEKGKETVELLNIEIRKLKGEVEQEKTRYINSKEKLSMAVTKGKALVQQRDTLKQAVAEKTSELDRCLAEMQEKSGALEAAELRNNELMQTAVLVNSLQEALSQRDMILGKCAEILLLSGAAAELQSSDIIEGVTWLANERTRLAPLSVEFQRLTYALSSLGLPEVTQSPTLESQVTWLLELYNVAKDQSVKLQDENHATMEAARAQIDTLTASLLAESQEKYYLKEVNEELTWKYEGIVIEKEQMVEEKYHLKEQAIASTESSFMDKEVLEKIQSLLYVKDQESKLYEQILEEDKMYRLQLDDRSKELRASKDDYNSLQINLQRSEEKASLLREKLSMAVKKGKGLVQERESMKQQMAEKNAQVEALTLDLQKQESTLMNQINMLSTQVGNLAKLESDLPLLKQERDQLEQFLFQSNTMLQQLFEAIDGIILPVDIKEPVEKVNWLATYLSESQVAKAQIEHELGYVKDEAGMLASKLTEALTTMKNLEDALSVSERNLSQLSEEKRQLELSRTSMEEELQKAREESQVSETQSEQELQILNEEIVTLNKKLVEALKNLKSVEDTLSDSKKTITQLTEEKKELVLKFQEALSHAENNISVVMTEKEEAQAGKFSAETELQKVKEEVSAYAINLDKAYNTIKSLEDAMSELKTNVSQFSQENEKALGSRSLLESDIKKVKEEADYHERQFIDASATIKTLENTVSELIGEKKNAEIVISTLKTELNTCRQELSGFFKNLQVVLKDESLFSLFKKSSEKKIESLKEIDHLLKEINYSIDSEQLQEESFQISTFVPHDWKSDEFNTEDMGRTLDNLKTKNQILADQFVRFSRLTDDMIESLLNKVEAIRNIMPLMVNQEKGMEEIEKVKEDNDAFHKRVIELETEIKIKEGELSLGLQRIIQKLGGDDSAGVKKSGDVAVVERLVEGLVLDNEKSRSRFLESQKSREELSTRVKHLEDFIQNRTAEKMQQERSIFEQPSLPAGSEISEIEDQTSTPVGKVGLPMVASAPHIRSLRKGSNDQLAITIDSESDRLLNATETVGDKGHIFKSLNTSGLVPVKGKMIADRVDGIWVSGDRALMRRPRARLGLIAYWLILHLWVLGTIL